jgi:Tfp pilus assembly PilM family ATPase
MLSYLRSFTTNHPAIGLDCGSRLFKAVQVRAAGGPAELVAAAAAPVPPAASLDATALAGLFRGPVRRMLSAGGFRGRRVVLSVPACHMYAASLRASAGDDEPDGGDRQWLPFPEAEAMVRRVDAGDLCRGGSARGEVVSLAVRRQVIQRYTGAASAAGLEVVGVTSEPEAVLGALALGGADSRLMRLVVDLGLTGTRVYAAVGRRLLFARCLRVGGATLERDVAGALGVGREQTCALRAVLPPLDGAGGIADEQLRKVDAACDTAVERLTHELRLCHHYVSATFGLPVHHIVFVGGGARHRRLWQRVASGVGLPARAADPLARLAGRRTPPSIPGGVAPSSWAVAAGLALDAAVATDGARANADAAAPRVSLVRLAVPA